MNNQTLLRASSARKVYHLGYSRLISPGIALVVALVAGVGLNQPFDPRLALICTVVFAAIFGIAASLLHFGIRLVVSDEGIEYRNMGFMVISPWDNIDSLASITLRGWTTESLLLRRDGLQTSGWFRLGMALVPAANAIHFISGHGYITRQVDMSDYSHVIPVGDFSGWKRGSLREEIQRCAPQAFSTNRASLTA